MLLENRLSKMIRRSHAGALAALLTASVATVACEESDLCSDDACADDAGGDPGRDDDSASGGKGSGGKDSGKGSGGKDSGKGSGGLGGAPGSGGKSGSAGGDSGSGGKKAEGSGGKQEAEPDPGAIEGRVTKTLFDILPGGTVDVNVIIERQGAFEGTVLLSLKSSDEFTGSRIFAAPKEDEVSLKVQAAFDLEQGYYDTALIAESSDGSLSVEIPVIFRVRGAMGTFDQTFGLQEVPDVQEGFHQTAVDDAGFIYVRTEDSLLRFDERGELDESFEPEGLAAEMGTLLLGMTDGVLVSTAGPSVDHRLVHVLGSGKRKDGWTGTSSTLPLLAHPFSLDRRSEKVAVAAEYGSSQSWIQLFSASGSLDTSFTENYFSGSSDTSPKIVRIDSQGRIIVANKASGTIHRLLPDGGLDPTFAEGVLELEGDTVSIFDVAVLSDDGLAIAADLAGRNNLITWTPAETGGLLESLDVLSYVPQYLFRLPDDQLLTVGYEFRNPSYFSYMYTRSREPVPAFGTNGRLDLTPLLVDAPEADGYPGFGAPALDSKARRLVLPTTIGGKAYVFAVWL